MILEFSKISKIQKENSQILFNQAKFLIYALILMIFWPTSLLSYNFYSTFYRTDLFQIHLKYFKYIFITFTIFLDIFYILFVIKQFYKKSKELDKYFQNIELIEKIIDYHEKSDV